MEYKIKKKQLNRDISYRYFIYIAIIISLLQLLGLKSCYQERITKLPDNLFASRVNYPISELTVDMVYGKAGPEASEENGASVTEEDSLAELDESQSNDSGSLDITDVQKDIVLKTLELLDSDIEYGYQVFPDTGYPSNNIWISTDVISMTLKECGYDLMELIYEDMINHKEDYPLDIKGRKTPLKYIDFRDVFFQEKFFRRNALTTLPHEYDLNDENRDFLWQPGDIVYFQFDEDNPYADLGGFVSPRTNEEGVPLVIMISSEFGKISEVDVLTEYKIVGHFRYPLPEVD